MLADWFCTIDGKRIGPFNAQQLKAAVAKGQIRPDHLVRRGEDGPWLPAGRIKGLFPEAAKANGSSNQPLKAIALPLAEPIESPDSDQTTASMLFSWDQEKPDENSSSKVADDSTFDVDQLNINEPPYKKKHLKPNAFLGSKKSKEQERIYAVLTIVIGIGFTIGLGAIGWAFATGQLNSNNRQNIEDPNTSPAVVAITNKNPKASDKIDGKVPSMKSDNKKSDSGMGFISSDARK